MHSLQSLTLKNATATLRPLGLSIRCKDGEYQIKPTGTRWDGPYTYFTSDLEDAVETALRISQNVVGPQDAPPQLLAGLSAR